MLERRAALATLTTPVSTGAFRLQFDNAEEIELVRERGYAQAVGEREPGLTAIAAPIRAARGELEAIVALQGPTARFDGEAADAVLPLLLESAASVSRELGWSASAD